MSGQRSYKGYVGVFRVDDDADVIRGKVVNTKDTITFQGETVMEAVTAFHESIDDYLDFCKSLGEPPEKPFSGKFLVRLKPEVHRTLSAAAQIKGLSFNKFVSRELLRVARKVRRLGTKQVGAEAKDGSKTSKSKKSADSTG